METGMKMKKSRPVVCFRRRRRRTNSAGTLACTFPCHLQRAEGLSQGERKAASRALIGVTLLLYLACRISSHDLLDTTHLSPAIPT